MLQTFVLNQKILGKGSPLALQYRVTELPTMAVVAWMGFTILGVTEKVK